MSDATQAGVAPRLRSRNPKAAARVTESSGKMPDGNMMSAILTLGYDPSKEKYVGSWIGSPMTTLFVYEGELDAKGESPPLNCTGPGWNDPTKTMQYQDIHEMRKDGTRLMRSQALGPDGKWMQFMSATYRRVT